MEIKHDVRSGADLRVGSQGRPNPPNRGNNERSALEAGRKVMGAVADWTATGIVAF